MYCAHCGKKLLEGADVCLFCGYLVRKQSSSKQPVLKQEHGKRGPIGFTFAFLSVFCFFTAFSLFHFDEKSPACFIYLCPLSFAVLAILYSLEKRNLSCSCLHCISFIIGVLLCFLSLFSLFYAISVNFC